MHYLARLVTIATIASPLLASGPARADTDRLPCAQQGQATSAPGTVERPCEPPPPPESAEPALGDQTHVFVMPTGNTLRAGQIAFHGHGLFLYDQLAYGMSDNIEISVSAPIIPLFASAGLRAQLMPRTSSLRLLVTGGISQFFGTFDASDSRIAISGSGTLAYQTDTLNLHVTIGAIRSSGSAPGTEGSSNAFFLALASMGAVLHTSGGSALFVEIGQLMDGEERGETLAGAAVGIKLIQPSYDVDLGMVMALAPSEDTAAFPLISVSYRL